MLNTDTPIDMADAISAFCDEGLALQFSGRHARDLRYVAAWGKWFKWTGKEWKRDDTLLALDLARDLCRYIARLTPDRARASRVTAPLAPCCTLRVPIAAMRLPQSSGTKTRGF
jgi:phage/plasmid-associated DNA primase